MGASQQKSVRRILLDVVEVDIENGPGDGAVGDSFLRHRDKQGACDTLHDDGRILGMNSAAVGVAVDRGAGSGNGDPAGRSGKHRADSRIQYAENVSFRITAAECIHRDCGDRIAGGDDHFYSASEQKFRVLSGKPADRIDRFVPVRNAGGVAEIQDVFIGQGAVDRRNDGQSAESGIENPDGSVVSLV